MTTEQEFLDSPLPSTSAKQYLTDDFKEVSNLRRRLIRSVLPAVLVPLVIAGAVGYSITERQAKAKVIQKLEADTLLGSKTLTTFIRDSFHLANLVIANPDVIQSIKVNNIEVEEQKTSRQSIEEIENELADPQLLTVNNSLNQYLEEIVESTQANKILITERNGFNIAFSSPFSNSIQANQDWWQETKEEGREIVEPDELEEEEEEEEELQESEQSEENAMAFSQAIQDPKTGEFLGVVMIEIPLARLNSDLTTYLHGESSQPSQFQIFESDSIEVLSNIDNREKSNELSNIDVDDIEISGGEFITKIGEIMVEVTENSLSLEEAEKLVNQLGVSEVRLHKEDIFSETSIVASFRYKDEVYSLATIPGTDFVSSGVINYEVVASAGRNLLLLFGFTTIVLGAIALSLITVLTQRLSKPLVELSEKTKQVKDLLQQQTNLTEQQRQEKEQLETAIHTLLEEISDATEGDLTVRANLDSLELSTVADLFNAIITNLQDIAIEAKQSTTQVGDSLKQNESAIRSLAEKAIEETRETRDTLLSVQQMTQSIQTVAQNASQAEQIVDDTYNTVLNSTQNMDLTVESILDLRKTVNESAKKMQRLGESSRKISQAVSLIEEIALKTNVLAINASAEADRAGEYGQGFAVVAQQVGTLAEQCSAATQEIANIVTAIQIETEEVGRVMESGTAKVLETTGLVEFTKESLSVVLQKSQEINQLMSSISQSTVSQADTSQNVTNLMQKIARLSETTSQSSQEVAQSIVETAQVAAKLQSTVAQFKVTD
jgi:twitching motility protein PilJ